MLWNVHYDIVLELGCSRDEKETLLYMLYEVLEVLCIHYKTQELQDHFTEYVENTSNTI